MNHLNLSCIKEKESQLIENQFYQENKTDYHKIKRLIEMSDLHADSKDLIL